jgi:aspartate aminotransferase
LEGPWDDVDRMLEAFRERREVIVSGLNAVPGVSCLEPGGAFYAFPNISQLGMSASSLADRLLDEAGVACLPGTSFGAYGENHLRFSYANSVENIRHALDAFKQLVS